MTWCNDCSDVQTIERISSPPSSSTNNNNNNNNNTSNSSSSAKAKNCLVRSCPSCGHQIKCNEQVRVVIYIVDCFTIAHYIYSVIIFSH